MGQLTHILSRLISVLLLLVSYVSYLRANIPNMCVSGHLSSKVWQYGMDARWQPEKPGVKQDKIKTK